MTTKICKKCKKELPITEYHKHLGFKDGSLHICKRCKSTKRTPEYIICGACGINKSYMEFSRGKTETGRSVYCKKCLQTYDRKELIKKRSILNLDYKEKQLEAKRASRRRNFIHAMWKGAKKRALKKGIEFSITESDITIPKICPILETPLVLGTKGNYEYTPSLDRIDNSLGYIKNNIQVISKKANSMKNSASLSELQIFCKNILRYSPNNTEKECIELEDKELLG